MSAEEAASKSKSSGGDGGDSGKQKKKLPRWLPLESNPDLLNSFLRRMGVDASVAFHDVFGLDPELLGMIPQPCLALCLLFPSQPINGIRREQLAEKCMAAPEEKGIFYLKQLPQFGNACGTIACVHAVANLPTVSFKEDSPLQDFIAKNRGLPAQEVGVALAEEGAIHEASEQSASDSAQTATPSRDDHVDGHFICFVTVDGHLLELDGMMPGPIDHGETSVATFVQDAAVVIKEQFMALDPGNVNFNVTALCQLA